MEYVIYALIAAGFAGIGFVVGILVGRNNAKDVEKVIANIQDDYQKAQKAADAAKGQIEQAARLLAEKVK